MSDRPAGYSPGYVRYALGLLLVVYTFNFIDRQILVILQESIKAEMGLSDAQLGLLSGFTFAIFYSTLGLPIARFADRGNRRNIIAWAIGLWSMMTVLCGMARSFPQLIAARIGVGVGEAGGSPPAHALISDYFPLERRGRALGIYSMGVYLGVLFGYVAGGWLNEFVGWRMAFVVVGVPGILVGLLVRFTLREPRRGESDPSYVAPAEPPRLGEVLSTLWRFPAFRFVALGSGLTSFVLYGTGNFGPSFFIRTHQLTAGEVGTALGLIGGIGGMTGTYLGGLLGDRLASRDLRWYLWVPAIATAIAIPVRIGAYWVSSPSVALGLAGAADLLALTYLGPVIAVSHMMVPPAMRAFTSSILLLSIGFIGLGLGPPFTGLVSDLMATRAGADNLRWAMTATSLAWVPAVLCLWLATRTLRAAVAK